MDFKVLIKEGCVPTRYMILAETRDWVGYYSRRRDYVKVDDFVKERETAGRKWSYSACVWDDQDKYGVTREIAGRVSLPTQDLVRLHQLVPELESIIILLTDEFRVVPSNIALTAGVFNSELLGSTKCRAERRSDYINLSDGVAELAKLFPKDIPTVFHAVEAILKKKKAPMLRAIPATPERVEDPELYDDQERQIRESKNGLDLYMLDLYNWSTTSGWNKVLEEPVNGCIAQGTKRRPPVRKTGILMTGHVREIYTGRLELGSTEFKKGGTVRTERLVDYYTGEVLETTRTGHPDILYIGTARYHDSRVRTVNEDLDLVTVSDPDLPVGTSVIEPGIPKRTRIVTDWYDDSCEISRTVIYPGKAPIRRVGTLEWPATSSRHVYRLGLDDEATWMSLTGEENACGYTLSQLFSETWDKTSPANSVRCIETRWGALTVRELEIDVTYQTAASIESLMIGLAGIFYDDVAPRDLEHCMVASQDLGAKLLRSDEIPLAVKSQIDATQLCIYRRDEGDTQRLVLALTSRVPEGAVVYGPIKSHWRSDLRELRSEMGLGWVREDTAELMEQMAPLHEKMGIELQNDFVPSGRGIYAAYFHGKELGDGIIKFGRSKDIRQRICKYEQGGGDMPPECEGMMTVLGWIHTDIADADDDANEFLNWCSEDRVKGLAEANGLVTVRTHNEYYWCASAVSAKQIADLILDEIRTIAPAETLTTRSPSKLIRFCGKSRYLDVLHFLQHLQDLGVDEAYLNKVRRTYANKLAKVQNSD